MARPAKHAADYFPHDVTHSSTIFVLESKYGNDGYALWFKLIEECCQRDGLVIDGNNPAQQTFLSAKTHLEWDIVCNILNTLADLNAIDGELWHKKQLIWINKLAQRLAPLYARRKVDVPIKPSYNGQKPRSSELMSTETPQSKVKYSKEDKSINREDDGQNVFELYESCCGKLNKNSSEMLNDWIDHYGEDKVVDAIKKADKQGKRFGAYIEGILEGRGKPKKHFNNQPPKGREYTEPDDIKTNEGIK